MNINEIVQTDNVSKRFFEHYDKNMPVILFGAGGGCIPAMRMLSKNGIKLVAITDNDESKWGKQIEKLDVLPVHEINRRYANYSIFVSAPNHAHEIIPDLRMRIPNREIFFFDYPDRINHENYKHYLIENESYLLELFNILDDELSKKTMNNMLKAWVSGDFSFYEEVYVAEQYFVPEIVNIEKDEIFLDIGAFTGDTIEQFLKQNKGNYKKIIAIEPNPDCLASLKKIQDKQKPIKIISKGAYSKKGKYQFVHNEVAALSKFVLKKAENGIEVDKVDNLIFEPVSMIKMDIEGLEQEALKGSIKTIKRNRPKLAICVYHKYDDLSEISQIISGMDLGYKLYLRHHSYYTGETVLYAV